MDRKRASIKRALATGLLGKTSNDFQAWQDQPEEWAGWVGYFRNCLKTWRKEGVYAALRELFRKTEHLLNLKRPDGKTGDEFPALGRVPAPGHFE